MGRITAGLVSGVWVLLLFVAVFGVVLNVPVVKGSGTIYIRADGSIDPSTAPIQRIGNQYAFTGDTSERIVVETSNIVVDGENYRVQGTSGGVGFTLNGNNVTLKNMFVTGFQSPGSGFDAAIYSFQTSNNVIVNNTISGNKWGINLEWVTSWTITGNRILDSTQAGIYMIDSQDNVITDNAVRNNGRAITLGGSSNRIYHNSFIDNTSPGFVVDSSANIWDNGYPSGGNYWSDYTGVDANGDGIGDTPYVIGANNTDHYPLMVPYVILEFPIFFIVPLFMMATLLAVIVHRKRGTKNKKTNSDDAA